MRKFIFFSLLGIIFFITALIGFLSASQSLLQSQKPFSTTDPAANQKNYLIVLVDQLDTISPELRSVWVLTAFQSANQKVISFIPLYPLPEISATYHYPKIFSLNPDLTVSKKFLRTVEANNIPIHGQIIFDEAGMKLLATWLAPTRIQPENSQNLFQTTCEFIRSIEPSSSRAKFDWVAFEPHFATDLAPDTLNSNWAVLIDPGTPLQCEVLER
jgi:hypothetical protein